jgi:uncharacterized protein (TIGR00251 family)
MWPSFVRRIDDAMELRVKVVAGASRSEIVGPLGDRLKLRVAVPAQGGKANQAVVELLREWLSVKDVEIVAGHSSREKTVRVFGIKEIGETQLSSLKGSPSPQPAGRSLREARPSVAAGAEVRRGETPRAPPHGEREETAPTR